jgi:hypothetical protein
MAEYGVALRRLEVGVSGYRSRKAVPSKGIRSRDRARAGRPVVPHSADAFVDKNGVCYCADWSGAGLYVMEYLG